MCCMSVPDPDPQGSKRGSALAERTPDLDAEAMKLAKLNPFLH